MKFHLIHTTAKPGGIEVLLPTIINSLDHKEFQVFVIRPLATNFNSVYRDLNITIKFGSNHNLISYIKFIVYCLRNKVDIFHLFNTGPVFLILLRLCGIKKIIYSIHGTKYWKKRNQTLFLRILWRFSLNKYVVITSNSNYSKSVFQNEISRKYHVQTLYNPIDTEKFSISNKKKCADHIKIIYVGRLTKGKGLVLWINTAIKIHSILPNTTFDIWGEGDLRKHLEKIIFGQNASDYIKIQGFRSDIYNVYGNSDLLLFLSEYESFGNVVVESILCGTPVIASAIPSMLEIFANYPDFIVPLDKNLEINLLEKINNLDKLKSLALKAAEEFYERFSVKKHIEQIERVYESFSS